MPAALWRGLPPHVRRHASMFVFGAAYFTAAFLASKAFGTNTPIWFANALAVAVLLEMPTERWPYPLSVIWLSDSAAIWFSGGPMGPLVALADLTEIVLVASLVRWRGGPAVALTSVTGLGWFILICLTVPLLSSSYGAMLLWWAEGAPWLEGMLKWYAASVLGMLVICPSLLIWLTPGLAERLSLAEFGRMLPFAASLAGVSLLVFHLREPAFLFVIFPMLLMLVWRRGLAGASIGSAIVIAIGLGYTLVGGGVIETLEHPAGDLESQIRTLQIYLATLTLASLPLAVVLTDQRRLGVELARVAQARSEFLAAMSHEIRTPMTAVLGMVDLLDSEAPTPRQRKQLGSIRASGKHLVSVLNDILDFSRIETGRLELERVDFSLPLLLEQVQNLLQPLALERGITLSVGLAEQSPPIVRGDPMRIEQILLNLAGNAIKFTPEGSVLVLAAYCPDASGPRFRFEVRDSGIGLAADQQLHIFDAFTQADYSTSRRYGGSGLGLAISKRLVDRMGGTIGVDSKLGEGSLFWFEIPLEPGDVACLAAAASVEAVPIVPRRILLAEDVALNRDIICTVLVRDGHHVVVAENGSEAVELAREQQFDLILMDVHMPVMDGLDATRMIRAIPGNAATTPIIALTANVMATEREKCREAGMDSVLMKPIEWDQVRAAIRDCAARGIPGQVAGAVPPSANGLAHEAAFDDATFSELEKLIPAIRLKAHADTLVADVRQLAEATSDSDHARIQQLAHGIVSQAGMLGLPRLSSRAAAVEQACVAGEALPDGLLAFCAASTDPVDYLLPRLSRPRP